MYFVFKAFDTFQVKTFQAIVVNYAVCVITSIAFLGYKPLLNEISGYQPSHFLLPFGLAFLFLCGFTLIAFATQNISISLSSVASRLSLIIPVIFGFTFLRAKETDHSLTTITGIIAVFIAIILISIPTKKEDFKVKKQHLWVIPSLFLLTGIIDTSLTLSNKYFEENNLSQSLPTMIFFFAFLLGGLLIIFRKNKIGIKELIGGLALGIPNFFSVYFLIKSLSYFHHNSAFIFPVNNLSVILLTTLISLFFYKERLSKINTFGLITSVIALALLIT